ncbi:tudor domain-containing protein 5-like [Schistocerca gregaria]|uniref:tudor domain-containing protein 5-like n=1 Tax=Schistocerca gregaria TaxID=7010 RepID=UPI00211DA91B|nr:tudor domain-containing protein 5-like [Schistocerca gregaria]
MKPLKSSQESGSVVFSRYERVECPSDVLTGDSVPHLEFPEAVTVGSVLPVIVRNVNSPAKFWINLVGPWFSERLDALYRGIEEFYEAQHENYYMPSSAINPGQFCICLYARKWLRAKILEVVHSNLVGVFFIDFGGTVFVTNNTLRFMHNSFAVVPIQCFRAFIPGVKPAVADEWPSDVCEYFRKEVSGKKLRARVERLFRRTYTLSVALLDDSDRSIADLLILCGLARMECLSTNSVKALSQDEQDEQGCSPMVSVKDDADTSYRQVAAPSPLQEDSTNSQDPFYSGNSIAERSDVTCGYVTVAGKKLVLVVVNSKLYFLFSDFVFAFVGLHEHVALTVLATKSAQLPLWTLDKREVKRFVQSLQGRSIAGLKDFRPGAAAVRLLPLPNATEVLKLLDVDDSLTQAVSTFVSSRL